MLFFWSFVIGFSLKHPVDRKMQIGLCMGAGKYYVYKLIKHYGYKSTASWFSAVSIIWYITCTRMDVDTDNFTVDSAFTLDYGQ